MWKKYGVILNWPDEARILMTFKLQIKRFFLNFTQTLAANGDTALHLASRKRDVDMVRILVDYGANVDQQNGDGQSPLHIAAEQGDEALVKYFYGVRASAGIIDNQGEFFGRFSGS